jgi:hypothetical protein
MEMKNKIRVWNDTCDSIYRSDDIATIPKNNGDTTHRKTFIQTKDCVWNTILQFYCLYFLLFFVSKKKKKTTTTKRNDVAADLHNRACTVRKMKYTDVRSSLYLKRKCI